MRITHKNSLTVYLSDWHNAMEAKETVQKSRALLTRLPQPVMSFTRREYGTCLMLELLDNRLKQIEGCVKDIDPVKDNAPFSKGYFEAMIFMDTTYIFLRSLLDDVAGIIEYFYKTNKATNVPRSFLTFLRKQKQDECRMISLIFYTLARSGFLS